MTREELLNRPTYWFENEQNELFRQVVEYIEKEGINQTELAERMNVTKGRVSQILKGNSNFTLKKLIEISLAIGLVPRITYKKIEQLVKEDIQLKSYYDSEQSGIVNYIIPFAKGIKNDQTDDSKYNTPEQSDKIDYTLPKSQSKLKYA